MLFTLKYFLIKTIRLSQKILVDLELKWSHLTLAPAIFTARYWMGKVWATP